MPLPEPLIFHISDLTKRWGVAEEDVFRMIREGRFGQIMICGPIGTLVRHYIIKPQVRQDRNVSSARPSLSSRDARSYQLLVIHSIDELPALNEGEAFYIPDSEVKTLEKMHGLGRHDIPIADSGGNVRGTPIKAAVKQTWIEFAQSIARQLTTKQKKLSLDKIAVIVRDKMNDSDNPDARGRGGKIPSADTIKRHALRRGILEQP